MFEALCATIAGCNAGGSGWTIQARGGVPGCDAVLAANQARGGIAGPEARFGEGERSVVSTAAEKRCKAGS